MYNCYTYFDNALKTCYAKGIVEASSLRYNWKEIAISDLWDELAHSRILCMVNGRLDTLARYNALELAIHTGSTAYPLVDLRELLKGIAYSGAYPTRRGEIYRVLDQWLIDLYK